MTKLFFSEYPEVLNRILTKGVAYCSEWKLNLNLKKETTKDELNDYLRNAALHSSLQKQIGYSISPEAVSTDFVGSRSAGTVDALATIAEGGKSCVVYIWYDN